MIVSFLVVLAFIPSVAFVIIYATGPWYTNIVGRTQMNLSVVIMLVLGLAVIRQFFELGEWLTVIRTIVYGLILVALWSHLIILTLIRRGKIDLPLIDQEAVR